MLNTNEILPSVIYSATDTESNMGDSSRSASMIKHSCQLEP